MFAVWFAVLLSFLSLLSAPVLVLSLSLPLLLCLHFATPPLSFLQAPCATPRGLQQIIRGEV